MDRPGTPRIDRRLTMKRLAWLLVAALVLPVSGAWAQAYPTKPVTMIVPFAAGGPTDIVARIVGEHMSKTLGQQVVIQNVSGAGGTTGATRAMRSDPDGYTILMGQMGTHAAAVALYPNLAYRPDADFEPIGQVGEAVVELTGGFIGADGELLGEEDVAGVEAFVHIHPGDAGLLVAGEDGGVDRRGAAVAREERGVEIEAA